MTTFDDQIVEAKVCPYCGQEPEYVDSEVIYGRSYGMIYLCRDCDAYVGVHKNSNEALGRLANKELREAKKMAHHYFDKLWQRGINKFGRKKNEVRSAAYKWLSEQLGTPPKYTHIGMFDVEYCNKVVQLCKPIVNSYSN